MAKARVHHINNYVCISNDIFRNKALSYKAKGLLATMLSLPDTWDFSVAGLAALASDGETAVRSAVQELESAGYLTRTPVRENGRIVDWEYDIYEEPVVENLRVENLALESKDNKVISNKVKKDKVNNNSKELLQPAQFQLGKGVSSNDTAHVTKKKQSLYDKCTAMIHEFTDDAILQEYLVNYLRVLLEMKRDGYILYANVWKGLLRKLSELGADDYERRQIVLRSIEGGWKSFYPLNNNSTQKSKPYNAGVHTNPYTDEELAELSELDATREKKVF